MATKDQFKPSRQEIDRRYSNTRKAMAKAGLDAAIISGSEYTGFEGAVRYMCGFHILHRYAYVLVPMEGEPSAVFPQEATWVGDHTETYIDNQVKTLHCGDWMANQCRDRGYQRVGVYGLNFIMPVRDYRASTPAKSLTTTRRACYRTCWPGEPLKWRHSTEEL